MGDLSPHFNRREFACHHCGKIIDPPPSLLASLEALRAMLGRPIRIVSGTRCAAHNRAVGGARHSRHLLGDAADLEPGLGVTVHQAQQCGFHGIGYRSRDRRVVHVDMRPTPAVFVDGR